MTVTISKRIPFLPFIKIPAATITFSGKGTVLEPDNVGDEILSSLFRGLEQDADMLASMSLIEIEPAGDFITYGVGISLMDMRHPEKARGRAPVNPNK